jgi:cellulose synthase/poly-beta-1,6-N-acetylglucosamine synthase-like glycosyltransferase
MSTSQTISIIVPGRNAADTLDACLHALRVQAGLPATPEIIVVDDGSTDATASIVRQHAPLVSLLQQPPLGAAAARNKGAFHASGSVLLFTDADCRPLPDWARHMSQAFEDPGVAGVKGFFRSDQPGLLPRLVQSEYEEKESRMLKQAQVVFADTASAAYRAQVFLQAGGFKTDMQAVEDTELAFRLAAAGQRIVLAPQAVVLHEHPTRWRDYAARKLRYGIWGAPAYLAFPERLRNDSRTPQTMRAQLLLAPSMALLGLASLVWAPARFALGAVLVAFLLTSLPFAKRAGSRGWALGVAAPLLVFVRGLALALGLGIGLTRHVLGGLLSAGREDDAMPNHAEAAQKVPGGEA